MINESAKYYDEEYYKYLLVRCEICSYLTKKYWRPSDFWKCPECVRGFIHSGALVGDRLGVVMANCEVGIRG